MLSQMFHIIRNITLSTPNNIHIQKCKLSTRQLTKTEMSGGIKVITMDHPKTRNALSLAMMHELLEAIDEDQNNKNLRAIVITACPPVFSSGHNLRELGAGTENVKNVFSLATQLMLAITKSQVPVIARVDGMAAAAGCQLVAQCDFALCTANSQFTTPGARFGIFCSTPGVALGRVVPRSRALHMLLTGSRISAQEALQSGLVIDVLPDAEKLDKAVSDVCSAIMYTSRSVIKQGRQTFLKQIQEDLVDAYKTAEKAMIEGSLSCDGQEGLNSFANKTKPQWKHSD